jgi:GntR family transcriptional regulator, transcriptional repressor for pyruvate dehydrogenase complex
MLKAVEKKRAYEDVVDQIRTLLDNGRLKQGDQLPTERELGELFKVSRATVREAIRTLESMKLVQSRQGTGTYVLASSQETLIQPLAAALFHEKDNISDIFFVRKVMEPYVAQLAAENASLEDVKALADIMISQEEAIADNRSAIELDSAFHTQLARMSRNPILERLLNAVVDLLEQSRTGYLQNTERAKKSHRGHHEIFTAVKNGDCTAARRAMRRHLAEVETIVMGKTREGGDKGK